MSNIQWGLKAEAGQSKDSSYATFTKAKDSMNQTFTNMRHGSNGMVNDVKTLDSSRTSKNNSCSIRQDSNNLLKSLDVGRGQLLTNEARE